MEVRPVAPGHRPAVAGLLAEARRTDGRAALSEQKQVDFEGAGEGRGFVALVDGVVAGYAHAISFGGGWEVELVLAPAKRSRGRYLELTEAVVARLPAGSAAHVWASHPDHVAALEAAGYEHFRELRQMRRPLPADHAPPLPAGMRLAAFRPGRDEEAWLAVHGRAFAEHPEGGAWDRSELERRMARPWFDPGDFLLAWNGDDLAAFCWTKVHDPEVGEIYIIGVDPAQQGHHLGRIMTLAGLDHLHTARGCTVGMLYVDADNEYAVKLYEHLGFHEAMISRCFSAR